MSQRLSIESLYNKSAERWLAWIRDITGLGQDTMTAAVAAATIAAILLTTTITWKHLSPSRKPVPFQGIPTPKGARPLVGHLFSIGRNRAETFHRWHQELGPTFYFRLGTKNILVLADPNATHDLLSVNGRVTSDRPESTIRYDFGEKEIKGIAFGQPSSKHYVALRKSVLYALGPKKLEEASPILCAEADEFVDIIATGKNIEPLPNLMRVSLNFIFLTVFNQRATSTHDSLYKNAMHIINTAMNLTHFKYIASQFIPVLKVLNPFIGIKKKSLDFHINTIMPFYLELIEKALDSDQDNMTKDLNEEMNQGKRGYYNNLLATIHDVILAGTDTTAVTISWGFLRISSMPEIQKKIQEEIDAFVNKYGRVPFFWERDEVPYMIAVQRECMRTRPSTEVGVAHAVSQDLEWQGTLIPKSTWIMANMTDAHLNPDKYQNPEKFDPDRFLGKEETMASSMNQKIKDRDHFNFGWGR
ncbi:hypothetical protein INT45_012247 [Circinella minor]|uniref:Cytochrome P450 n=1 Tax=Circinella minor TaxID=1195481 RepID=A0A8H7RZH0_9FUNG|nr:hypothetical protein INT45_012247 [Circinella minor]